MGFAVAGLSVFVVLLVRQNAVLRGEVLARDRQLSGRATDEGLKAGDRVGEIGLFDTGGVVSALAFGAESEPALVFVVSSGCGACDLAMPDWDGLVGGGMAGTRVVCVDVGAREASSLEAKSAVLPWYGSHEPGWLREVPITPTALVVRGDGLVMEVWHGHRAARRTEEIRAALFDAALGG